MLGAILGDIVGSPYEFDHNNYKHKDFPLLSEKSHFTDDTVMAVAVERGLIAGKGIPERTFEETKSEMQYWGEKYPHAGYGGMFHRWLHAENPKPYAVSATARLRGCRQRAGCSIRWTKRWKWQK